MSQHDNNNRHFRWKHTTGINIQKPVPLPHLTIIPNNPTGQIRRFFTINSQN